MAGLAEQGVREVTLLGQNVNAYRGAMGGTSEIADFALLIEYVAEIPGIERIRYTTSHPKEFTSADRAVRPLRQAGRPPAPAAARLRPRADGDEARLQRAGVQEHHPPAAHVAAEPVAVLGLHRRLPGETEADFDKLMAMIEEIGYDTSFSFIFSPRPGTPAASLHDDTPHEVKLRRLQHLQATIEENVQRISRGMVGTVQRIRWKARRARTRPSCTDAPRTTAW